MTLPSVEVKLKLDTDFSKTAPESFRELSELKSYVDRNFPNVRVKRVFPSLTSYQINELVNQAVTFSEETYKPPNFFAYRTLRFARDQNPYRLVSALSSLSYVEKAYVVPSGGNPSEITQSDNRVKQTYLDPAPHGIDAESAWNMGGRGKGRKFVDIERGWSLKYDARVDVDTWVSAHGDLTRKFSGKPRVFFMGDYYVQQNYFHERHGDSVLGIVMATDNDIDIVGITPDLEEARVVQYLVEHGQDLPDAIARASAYLDPGDVMLIEIQLMPGNLPIEATELNFLAIQLATSAGIVVVEAAGNGSLNFDDPAATGRFASYPYDFSPLSPDASDNDSGAILVGACDNPPRIVGKGKDQTVKYKRYPSSNYGSRVDCFAHGNNVFTLADHHFNGTSAASAIVAGAALSVSSVYKKSKKVKKKKDELKPKELRALLRDESLNTKSADPAEQIGVMPDMSKIVQHLSVNYPRLKARASVVG